MPPDGSLRGAFQSTGASGETRSPKLEHVRITESIHVYHSGHVVDYCVTKLDCIESQDFPCRIQKSPGLAPVLRCPGATVLSFHPPACSDEYFLSCLKSIPGFCLCGSFSLIKYPSLRREELDPRPPPRWSPSVVEEARLCCDRLGPEGH